MCHSVIDMPIILFTYLAYPVYDTLEYSKMKCYNGDSVHLQNIYSIGHKKSQQAFLAPLPGKHLAKDIVE